MPNETIVLIYKIVIKKSEQNSFWNPLFSIPWVVSIDFST